MSFQSNCPVSPHLMDNKSVGGVFLVPGQENTYVDLIHACVS